MVLSKKKTGKVEVGNSKNICSRSILLGVAHPSEMPFVFSFFQIFKNIKFYLFISDPLILQTGEKLYRFYIKKYLILMEKNLTPQGPKTSQNPGHETKNPEKTQFNGSPNLMKVLTHQLKDPSIEICLEVMQQCTTTHIDPLLKVAAGKNCKFVVGISGDGKSTLINAIDGKRLYFEEINGINQLVCQNPIATIGCTAFSQTFLPYTYLIGQSLVMSDCAGAKDNRHPVINICNTINLVKLLESVDSVSILLVVSLPSLIASRGGIINDLIALVQGLLGDTKKFIENDSIKVNITKWQAGRQYPNFNLVLNQFVFGEQNPNGFRYRMKQTNNVHYLDVLQQNLKGSTSVHTFKEMLINMKGIKNKEVSNYSISLEKNDILFLTEVRQYFQEKINLPSTGLEEILIMLKKIEYLQKLNHPEVQKNSNLLDETILNKIKRSWVQKSLVLAGIQKINQNQGEISRKKVNNVGSMFSKREKITKAFDQSYLFQYNAEFYTKRLAQYLAEFKLLEPANSASLQNKFQVLNGHLKYIKENALLNQTFNLKLVEETERIFQTKINLWIAWSFNLASSQGIQQNSGQTYRQKINSLKDILQNGSNIAAKFGANYIENYNAQFYTKRSAKYIAEFKIIQPANSANLSDNFSVLYVHLKYIKDNNLLNQQFYLKLVQETERIIQIKVNFWIAESKRLASCQSNQQNSQTYRQKINNLGNILQNGSNIARKFNSSFMQGYNTQFYSIRCTKYISQFKILQPGNSAASQTTFSALYSQLKYIKDYNFLDAPSYTRLYRQSEAIFLIQQRLWQTQCFRLTQIDSLENPASKKFRSKYVTSLQGLPDTLMKTTRNEFINAFQTNYQQKRERRVKDIVKEQINKINFKSSGYSSFVNVLYVNVLKHSQLVQAYLKNVYQLMNIDIKLKTEPYRQTALALAKNVEQKQFQTPRDLYQQLEKITDIKFIKPVPLKQFNNEIYYVRKQAWFKWLRENVSNAVNIEFPNKQMTENVKRLFQRIKGQIDDEKQIQKTVSSILQPRFKSWVTFINNQADLQKVRVKTKQLANQQTALSRLFKQCHITGSIDQKSLQESRNRLIMIKLAGIPPTTTIQRDKNRVIVQGNIIAWNPIQVDGSKILEWNHKRTFVLIAITKIILKCDFRYNVNLVLLAPEIQCETDVTIDLSGNNGQNGKDGYSYQSTASHGKDGDRGSNGYGDGQSQKSGKSGGQGQNGSNGSNGGDGENGKDGAPSGNLHIITQKFSNQQKLTIFLKGGNAGNGGKGGLGQCGGNGGKGGRGGNGEDADGIWAGHGGHGGNGGWGGNGGNGGRGGNGGNSGRPGLNGTFYYELNPIIKCKNIQASIGQSGKGGLQGQGGSKGYGNGGGDGGYRGTAGSFATSSSNGSQGGCGKSGNDGCKGDPGTIELSTKSQNFVYPSKQECLGSTKEIYRQMISSLKYLQIKSFL